MGDETKYFVYAVMVGSVIANIFLLFNLPQAIRTTEYIVLAIMVFATIYVIFNLERKDEYAFHSALILFALVALNSVGIYVYAKDINYLFLGLLNVLGLYLTTVIIPKEEEEFELPPRPVVEEIPEIKPHKAHPSHLAHPQKKAAGGMTKKEAEHIVEEIEEFIHEEKEAKKAGVTDEEAEEPLVIEEIKPMGPMTKKKKPIIKETFVGSLKAKVYHKRSCARAKALPEKNKVVFLSKLEAEANGFKPHDCVEE